jgi:DNA helicase-2/ATP-dependent DNA helicase PcrA
MARAAERFTKNLHSTRAGGQKPVIVTCQDEEEQCGEVCDRVLARREEGTRLQEQAVLFRASHHSDQLEIELTRRNIPFVKYGGLKFVEAAHVKDLLALLRVLENPFDELSWFRVLQLLQGIGPAVAGQLVEKLGVREGAANPLQRLAEQPPAVPPAAEEEWSALRAALAECAAAPQELGPAGQIERLRKFYEPVFQRAYDNAAVRVRDLDQLELIAGRYPSRGQFIADLTLDPPASTQDLAGPPLLDEDYLILSTIHSAKGGEWDVVHLIHVADGMLPSDMATGSDEEIEEERRLLYVAMTRARDSLTLYFPLRYYHSGRRRGDRHSYAQLTRFIPEADYQFYERLGARAPALPSDDANAAGGATEAVDTLLRGLWE